MCLIGYIYDRKNERNYKSNKESLTMLPLKDNIINVIPANTVRNITFVKVPFSSFMDERNEDVLRT